MTSARAQTPAVRLQVSVDSWLESTPIDIRAEVSAKLHDAGIEVTEDSSAPIVTIDYLEEAASAPYYPRLVPGTRIKLETEIRAADGSSRGFSVFYVSANSRPQPSDHFPSAAELRANAIDALRADRQFLGIGYLVGGHLGLEASLRELIRIQEMQIMAESLLFGRLTWSPSRDDLFEQAIRGMTARGRTPATVMLERFLQQQISTIRPPGSPIGAFLAALDVLGERGGSAAVAAVRDFISTETNPAILVAAESALVRIAERQKK